METPTLQGINQSEQDKKDLSDYAKNPKVFLLLSGKNGSGKSYAAEAIYNANTNYRLPQKNPDLAIFITQFELSERCIDAFFSQGARKELIEEFQNTRLLVIDDLGVNLRRPTDAVLDFLQSLIDFRWRNRGEKGTIISTNMIEKETRELFGDAFNSRISSGIIKRWDHQDRRMIENRNECAVDLIQRNKVIGGVPW